MMETRNIVNSLIYNTQISSSKIKVLIQIHCYNEGVGRMCRGLEVNGTIVPVFHTDDFILKVTVSKVTEKVVGVTEKLPENNGKLPENSDMLPEKLPENRLGIIDRIIRKANSDGDTLRENKIAILRLIIDDPYISKQILLMP